MAKDVNIHIKSEGAEQTKQQLNSVAQATEEMGAKSSRSAGWIKEAFTALVGPLGIAAVVGLVVGAVRKIIAAFDDMKRASAEAVQELANQQRAAASFFESVNAYSGPQRKAAMAQAREVQAKTGLPFESSMQLLEAQKRTFGEVNPQSTEQFAAYWQLHAGAQTGDMIRWMGESGIKTPDQQGQIMRMISAVAEQNRLKPEDIIQSLSTQGERFRYLGWSPEETITNIGKVLTPGGGQMGITRLFGALENFTPEKAKEMKAPAKIAKSEQARMEWIKTKAATMSTDRRDDFMHKAFGPQAPYVNKLLFEPTSPELQQAIDYAKTPQASTEAKQQFEEFKKTPEGIMGKAKASEGLKTEVSPQEALKAAIRTYGQNYIEFLRTHDRLKYEEYSAFPLETAYNKAALDLWQTTQPLITETTNSEPPPGGSPLMTMPIKRQVKPGWEGVSEEEKIKGLEAGRQEVGIHYHNETVYNPVAGTAADRDQGPRVSRDFK